uniref:Uncharacterized protein n=1 Tax=Strigamia maritima TaxID=126957 RepID=T1J3D4_STRMM
MDSEPLVRDSNECRTPRYQIFVIMFMELKTKANFIFRYDKLRCIHCAQRRKPLVVQQQYCNITVINGLKAEAMDYFQAIFHSNDILFNFNGTVKVCGRWQQKIKHGLLPTSASRSLDDHTHLVTRATRLHLLTSFPDLVATPSLAI